MGNKWIKVSCIMALFLSSSVHAQDYESVELADPYILSQELPVELIGQETCIQLIRGNSDDFPIDESLPVKLEELRQELKQLEETYQSYSIQIEALQKGDQASLAQLNGQMESLIDQIYQEAKELPSFQELAEEDQLDWISQDPRVQELEEEMSNLENQINQLIVEQNTIESRHQQVSYDIDTLEESLNQQEDSKLQRNQCLLYPYSSPFYQEELGLLSAEGADLADFLTQVDQKLQKLVPQAYRQVSFADIQEQFETLLVEGVVTNLTINKVPVLFDPINMQTYQYAKEIGLNEVQLLANYAYQEYVNTKDFAGYQQAYQDLCELKEAQFHYFMAINAENFSLIKESLADFLNHNHYIDQATVQKINTLHQRYQIHLVSLDSHQELWQSVPNSESGYQPVDLSAAMTNPVNSEINKSSEEDSSTSLDEGLISVSDPKNGQNNQKLDQIKDKLKKKGNKNPPKHLKQSPNKAKEKKAKQEKGSKPTALPTTGELAPINRILLALFLAGLAGVLLIRRHKLKKRGKQKDTPMD